MLTRLNRFHGHGGVRRVYRLGRPTRTALFSLHANRHDKLRASKAAVVVSKKVHKNAVVRNRIRRRIYELVRHRLPNLNPPVEVIITVYQDDPAEMSASELASAIDELFERAGL